MTQNQDNKPKNENSMAKENQHKQDPNSLQSKKYDEEEKDQLAKRESLTEKNENKKIVSI
jgi:hypothetical protein